MKSNNNKDLISRLSKNLRELKIQKESTSKDLNFAREKKNKFQTELKKAFWADFLMGGLIVSGVFLIIESFQFIWPFNLIAGVIILSSGLALILFKYGSIKLKEHNINKNLKDLEVELLVDEGGIEFYKQDYDLAMNFWDKALLLNPKSADALNGKGAIFSNIGKHLQSLPYFEKALKYDPNNNSAWMNKGITNIKLNQYETAVNSFNKVIDIDPKNKDPWKARAEPLKKLGRVEEALQSYDKVIEIDNKDIDAWFDKGNTLIKLEKLEEGIKNLEKVIEINPNDKEAFNLIGGNLLLAGKAGEALKFIEKAIEIDDSYIVALNNKAAILIELNREEEALDNIKKVLKIDEENKEAWNNKGFALQKLKKYELALQCYNKALEFDPYFTLTIYNKACLKAIKNNKVESIKYLKRVKELDVKFFEKMINDPYLDHIRDSEEFNELIQKNEENNIRV